MLRRFIEGEGKALAVLLSLALAVWLILLLSPILTPLLVAVLFAYWCRPLHRWLTGRGLPEGVSAALVFVLLFAMTLVMVLLLPVLAWQLSRAGQALALGLGWLQQSAAPWIELYTGLNLAEMNWFRLPQSAVPNPGSPALLTSLGFMVLVPVTGVYLLRDWDGIQATVSRLMAGRAGLGGGRLMQECRRILSSFLYRQLPALLVLSVFYTLSLYWIGIELAVLIGVLAGLASIVPFLGPVLGLLFASLVMLPMEPGLVQFVMTLIVFVAGHLATSRHLTTRLIGTGSGLHPLVAVLAALVGGRLMGPIGVLLAIPLAATATAAWRSPRGKQAEHDRKPDERDPVVPDEPLVTVDESMRQEDA